MPKTSYPWKRLVKATLASVEPAALMREWVRREKDVLKVGSIRYDLKKKGSAIYVIGAGKASAVMAAEAERILGRSLAGGVVVTRYGYGVKTRRIEVHEAGHPIPDLSGVEGSRKILDLVARSRPTDLIIALWSGGGSALLPAPVDGVSLEEKQHLTDLLLKSGAAIHEVNSVRKHLSKIKGGRLGLAAAPRPLISLILSDVRGNRLDVIASGPAVPDESTFQDAVRVLKKYGLFPKTPMRIRNYLELGARGQVPETPKPGPRSLSNVRNLIIGDNKVALRAASREAKALGFNIRVLPGFLEGEAREAALRFVKLVRVLHRRTAGRRSQKPVCLLAGGETTVTIRGRGKGGRCQEFVLASVRGIAGPRSTAVFAFGTDGMDGPTDAAGARADHTTLERALEKGLDPDRCLEQNDSNGFFASLGDLIVTGPTGTNVNDLYIALVY